jgi:hypothetical protein
VSPHFHYASNMTRKHNAETKNRNHWVPWFIFAGACGHSLAFGKNLPPVPKPECAAVEAKWDAEAEKLFAESTRTVVWDEARRVEWQRKNPGKPLPSIADGWTEEQRAAFREKLWPAPKLIVPIP